MSSVASWCTDHIMNVAEQQCTKNPVIVIPESGSITIFPDAHFSGYRMQAVPIPNAAYPPVPTTAGDGFASQLQTLQAENQDLRRALAIQQRMYDELEQHVASVQNERDGFREQARVLELRRSALQAELDAKKAEAEVKESKYQRLDHDHSRTHSDLKKVEEERAQLATIVLELEVQIAALRGSDSQMRATSPQGDRSGPAGFPTAMVPAVTDEVTASQYDQDRLDSAPAKGRPHRSRKVPDDKSKMSQVLERASESLPKIDFSIRNRGEEFFKSLKEKNYISDYDDQLYICYCQAVPTELFTISHRVRAPNKGKRGFSHLGPKGPNGKAIPFNWRPWASHASHCSYVKVSQPCRW
jgi:hypothetical protein